MLNLTKSYFKYKVFLDLWPNMGRHLCYTEEIPVRFRAGKGHFQKVPFMSKQEIVESLKMKL